MTLREKIEAARAKYPALPAPTWGNLPVWELHRDKPEVADILGDLADRIIAGDA